MCLFANRGYMWSENINFFLKMLNREWLVDLKHNPLEDKEVTKIVGHQELSVQEGS